MAFTHAVSTNNYGPSKFIVTATAANGTHTTIAGASADASSGDTIFIRPGTYAENFTPTAGVAYVSYDDNMLSGNVTIVGKMSISATGTYSFSGLAFQTNSDNILTITGSNTISVQFSGCKINAASATGLIANNANSTINLYECITVDSSNNLVWNITSGNLVIKRSSTNSTSVGVSTIAAGNLNIYHCDLSNPISASGSTLVVIENSFLNCAQNAVALDITGTVTASASNTYFSGGTSSAISVGSGTNCVLSNCDAHSSNTNAISGSGTLQYTNLALSGSSIVLQSTLTLTRLGVAQAGTFTPVVAGGSTAGAGTYTTQTGRYQVIGRLCFISITLVWTAHTGTGTINITGLPFSATSAQVQVPLKMYSSILVTGSTELQPLIAASDNKIIIYGVNTAAGSQQNSVLASNTNVTVCIEGFYEI